MFSEKNSGYRVLDWEIDPGRETLARDGNEIHLRRKSYRVLLYLLENRERLVLKEELMKQVWADTAVTDDVLVQCVKDIRRSFDDDPHHPRIIKTVPGSGYRFIAPVLPVPPPGSNGNGHNSAISPPPVARSASRIPVVPLVVIAAIAVLTIGWLGWPATMPSTTLTQPGRRSVAVMFFENRSNSPELDWLREGVADMLIADLSSSDKLAVYSRNQVASWLADRSIPAGADRSAAELETARRLKATTLITGGFAQLGERVRLDVQILDSESGTVIATENLTVDKPEQLLTDIDLISLKIARHLDAVPAEARSVADVMTDDLAAFRFYSLGVEKARSIQIDEAVALLKQAVARDPRFAMAHARIGYAYAVMDSKIDEGKPHLEKAYQLTDRLSEKDRLNITAWYAIANRDFTMAIANYREIIARYPLETEAYGQLAKLLSGEGKAEDAIAVVRQGLSIDPMARNLHNTLGSLLSRLGRHDEAIAAHQRYVEIAPTDPNAYDSLGLSYQWAGEYRRAIENYQRALDLNPNFDFALVHLANARVRLGQYNIAIELFKKYGDLADNDPERERGFHNLALLYLKRGDIRTAAQAAAKTRTYNKESLWPAYMVAVRQGRMSEARSIAARFLEHFLQLERGRRGNPRIELYFRGTVALDEGRGEEALEAFREALTHPAVTWNLDDFEDRLASALLRLGRYDEAIAEYDRILRLSPHYPLAHFSLAQAYAAKGQSDHALASYRQFVAEWADADADIPEIEKARKYVAAANGTNLGL